MNHKVILIVSFGSSYQEARDKAIKPVEEAIASAFEGYDIERAYTSNRIRAKLHQEGIRMDSPLEALEKLIEKGYTEIYIQPLHIIAGYEYEKIQAAVYEHRKPGLIIALGNPLLVTEADLLEVVEALKCQINAVGEDKKVILVGHGTEHSANEMYHRLEQKLIDAKMNVVFGTIEGGVADVLKKLEGNRSKEWVLMPFLLVAGDHVINDMMGDDENAWVSMLTQAGYTASVYAKGLGEHTLFQQLYVKRLKEFVEKGAVV